MTAKQIDTRIEIAASPQRVWRELTSFAHYPEWSRFILAIEGEPRAGARLAVKIMDGRAPITFRPELRVARENEELCWEGKLGASFLFSGRHYFRLESLADGYTRLTHGETFGGVLLPLLWGTLRTRTRTGFADFNEALRARAERTRT